LIRKRAIFFLSFFDIELRSGALILTIQKEEERRRRIKGVEVKRETEKDKIRG
jgi:hypothetical protein